MLLGKRYSKVLDASAEVLLAFFGAFSPYKPSCFKALRNQHRPNHREGCYKLSMVLALTIAGIDLQSVKDIGKF
jgi:hypothetical protein